MPARVLWVIKGLGPGGAERLLCAAARAHDQQHFHIECAYVLPWKDHLAEELERAGVKTHCLSRKRTDYRWPLRLAELVRDGEWDIVHVHSPLPGSVARLATRTMRKADSTEAGQYRAQPLGHSPGPDPLAEHVDESLGRGVVRGHRRGSRLDVRTGGEAGGDVAARDRRGGDGQGGRRS